MALKEEKTRNGGTFDGHTTLRRNAAAKHSSGPLTELQKIRRQNVDSGYSTSDGYDKRWSQELPGSNGNASNSSNGGGTTTVTDNGNPSKWSPTQSQSLLHNDKHTSNATSYSQFQSQSSGNSTPTLSPSAGNNNNTISSNQSDELAKLTTNSVDNSTPKRSNSNGSNSNRFVFCELNLVFIHAKRFISCCSIHSIILLPTYFQHVTLSHKHKHHLHQIYQHISFFHSFSTIFHLEIFFFRSFSSCLFFANEIIFPFFFSFSLFPFYVRVENKNRTHTVMMCLPTSILMVKVSNQETNIKH